ETPYMAMCWTGVRDSSNVAANLKQGQKNVARRPMTAVIDSGLCRPDNGATKRCSSDGSAASDTPSRMEIMRNLSSAANGTWFSEIDAIAHLSSASEPATRRTHSGGTLPFDLLLFGAAGACLTAYHASASFSCFAHSFLKSRPTQTPPISPSRAPKTYIG